MVLGPDLDPGDDPAARLGVRHRSLQRPGLGGRAARGRPVLPVVHLPVPARCSTPGCAYACWIVSSNDLLWWQQLGYALTVGTVAGVAINTAHELGHKKERSERLLAKLALAQSGYGHFYVEHNRGHHNRVATPEDPASSRLGESFWAFLPRTVVGSIRSAWALEAKRLTAQGKRVWSTDNDVLTAWAMSVVLFSGLTVGVRRRRSCRSWSSRRSSGSRSSRSSTTSSTTGWPVSAPSRAATNAARPSTPGTPTTSRRT